MITITAEQLADIIALHKKWLHGEPGGKRADLSCAYLSGANLSDANLSRADLSRADLSCADLSRADLSCADLSRANLSGANLSGADLSGAKLSGADLSRADLSCADLSRADLSCADLSCANLSGANLSGANLSRTCLSVDLLSLSREFARACPPAGKHGGRIVWRTAVSQHCGNTQYDAGHTYIANALSWDCATECHPGIYAGPRDVIAEMYQSKALVRCYVRDGEWTICAKNDSGPVIRCARLRVLSEEE